MPDSKTSAYAVITAAEVVDADLLDWVDSSDTTMAATGTNKKSTRAQGAIALARWIEVEVDFGTKPVTSKQWTVTDALVESTFKIAVQPSPRPATGRVGNDFAWDAVQFTAVAGSGNFVLYATALSGHVKGKRKIMYQVSS